MFDGAPVPAEFVRTNAGLKLRMQVGPGYGSGAWCGRTPAPLPPPPPAPCTPRFTLTPPWLSPTHFPAAGHTLRVHAPDGTALTAPVSYAAPSILRTAPLATDGGEVVLMGENLGTAADAAAGLLAVTFDGVPATGVTTTQDHKKVKCLAPPGLGTARIQVTLGSQTSAEYEALFAPPTVHSLDPPDMDPAGGFMTITGQNFGAAEDRVQVLLPEVGGQMVSVELLEAHRALRVKVPPIPSGWEQGLPLRMRVVVAGVFAAEQVDLVYSPPGGVAARDGRPAYITRRRVVTDSGKAGVTPLTHIFAAPLSAESRGGASASPGSASSSSSSSRGGASGQSPAAAGGSARPSASPVVRGALAGEGPTLTVTPPSKWQPDTASCQLCTREFGLSRRRHHCRVCGNCVCASCSPFELRLSAAKPPVRICSRCNLRVGLLTQMTACLDAIEGIKKMCGVDTELYHFFRGEVVQCVSTPVLRPQASAAGGGGGGGSAGKGVSSPMAASASKAVVPRASVTPIGGLNASAPLEEH